MSNDARISFAVVFLALLSSANVYSQKIEAVPDSDFAHILSVARYTPDPAIKIEPVTGLDRSSLVRNSSKTREAFVLCVPVTKGAKLCDLRVFVREIAAKMVYMITGEPDLIERNRPVDGLKWINSDVLSYERWSEPHFGHRYVVNMKLKKQTAAFVLTG